MVKFLDLSAVQFTLAHVPIGRAVLTVNRGEWCERLFTDAFPACRKNGTDLTMVKILHLSNGVACLQ